MVDPSCVLDLPMDEIVGGKVLDRTAYHNDGTLVGALHLPTLVAGKIGNGILFDGTEDKITTAYAANLAISNAITFNLWVKPTDTGGIMNLIDRGDLWQLFAIQNAAPDNFYWYFPETTAPAWAVAVGNTLFDGGWHMVTGTYDKNAGANNQKIFIDAVQITQQTNTGVIKAGVSGVQIGSHGAYWYKGIIDEVRIYNTAKPIAEIRRIYDTGLNGHPNSIAALAKGVPTW